jgi:beta-aspartyl-peptidase (threonine type)
MKKLITLTMMLVAVGAYAQQAPEKPIVLVVHGGAGTLKSEMLPAQEQQYVATLTAALQSGHEILAKGGSSLDAVEAAIRVLEDSPLFNAGKGAVFTHEGRNELDASIMDGRTKAAGAVASVTTIKNPIRAARAVMEKSATLQEKAGSVLMVGHGAEVFATQTGLEMVDPSYFRTQQRWDELQKFLRAEQTAEAIADPVLRFGTVGAVALDRQGNLAAGTSTGGRTGKRHGRVGDSPIIGAGTYADNETCAVSATGTGEYFIRQVVAYDITARMKYRGSSVQQAAEEAIFRKLQPGDGGLIALDGKGNFVMPFSTQGMYRGYTRADGVPHVAIFKEP